MSESPHVDDGTVTISLELRFEGDSLSGRASDGTGAAVDFTGWLGLVSAIDALVFREEDALPLEAPESAQPGEGD